MLADAGDERLDLGENATKGEIGYAAFRKGSSLQIVLFRQKMKNLDLPPEPVSLMIETDTAPVSVTARRIDETHGNPLKVWQEMGSPFSLNKAEVNFIREQSAVVDAPVSWNDENNGIRIETELGCNDVVFYTISL
jgi:xylan 1,4-beta-xylosidase